MDSKTKILIVSPIILIIMLIVIAQFIHFKKEPSAVEKEALNFKPSDITIKERQSAYTGGELNSPIEFDYKGSFPPISLDTLAPQTGSEKKHALSLIVIGPNKKGMAILNGVMVKEGESFKDLYKVIKIQPDRVLLKNKQDKATHWVYMEGVK